MAVTTNVLQRTFNIKSGNQIGTAFTLDIDGRQYLITAKHVLSDYDGRSIEISQNDAWHSIGCSLIGHGADDADVSALAPDTQLSPTHPLDAGTAGIVLAQTAYFLGFPYGYQNRVPTALNSGLPLPLVKAGLVSSTGIKNNDGVTSVLLDGHNNPGFSGGPVVFIPNGKPLGPKDQFRVAGVVSSYPSFSEPVFDAHGNETDLHIRNNPGFVTATDIRYVTELIEQNPAGYLLAVQAD